MMGVAAGLVWDRIDFEKRVVKALFFCHSAGIKCFVVVFVWFTNPMLAGIIILWL
jgi:tryptophan-rich sensory protein